MQQRKHSLIEAWSNIAIGYGINFTANLLIFPLYGWEITVTQNLEIGLIFTAIALARNYLVRRWFTRWTE